MKKIVVAVIAIICFTMCGYESIDPRDDVLETDVTIESMVRDLYINHPNADYDYVESYVCAKLGKTPDDLVITKSDYQPSQVAIDLVKQISEVVPSSFESKEEYISCLQLIANTQKDYLLDGELDAIGVAITVSAEIIQLKFGDPDTKSFKEWCKKQWEDWGRCVAGIVGEAGLGAIAGAALGGIEGCGIGAVPGAIIGGICGGLDGASSSC